MMEGEKFPHQLFTNREAYVGYDTILNAFTMMELVMDNEYVSRFAVLLKKLQLISLLGTNDKRGCG